jgi:hypothetical protein
MLDDVVELERQNFADFVRQHRTLHRSIDAAASKIVENRFDLNDSATRSKENTR